MRLVKKYISSYLKEMLEEQEAKTGQPFNKLLARRLIDIGIDPNSNPKDVLAAITLIADRVEGKAVQTNINAEVPVNPLEGIDTETIQRLKSALDAAKKECP